MTVDIVVPHNTSAHIILPGATSKTVHAGGIPFSDCSDGAEAEIGSGIYRFSYPY